MEIIGGLAVLAVIVGVVVLWGKIKDSASGAINRKVLFRGDHAKGQSLTQGTLTFQVSKPTAQVIETIVRELDLPHGNQSAVLGRMYVAAVGDDGIVFESGSKLGRSFRSQLLVREGADALTAGSYTVTNWTQSDGIVSDVGQMSILERRIREIVTALEGSATFQRS